MLYYTSWWTASLYLISCLLLLACTQEEMMEDRTFQFVPPSHFPAATYSFKNNPISQAGFELGRKLFNDPSLSSDNSVACSNCHLQTTAFADSPNHPLSVGVDNRLGKRNAPSLVNMAFYPEFMWDGGITHLDFVAINAIQAEFEMNETLQNIINKLNRHPEYPALFKKAFQTDSVTTPYFLYALSQFMVMMVSDQSRYDDYLKGNTNALNAKELAGLEVFQQKCSTCHSGALLTDFSFRNNGLDSIFQDEGRAIISETQADIGKFRVPSLRNVARTAPYMHDGRFRTLQEVLEHYALGVTHSSTLDKVLQLEHTLGIPLTPQEQEDIIAFLNTLTDFEFINDAKFRN